MHNPAAHMCSREIMHSLAYSPAMVVTYTEIIMRTPSIALLMPCNDTNSDHNYVWIDQLDRQYTEL